MVVLFDSVTGLGDLGADAVEFLEMGDLLLELGPELLV